MTPDRLPPWVPLGLATVAVLVMTVGVVRPIMNDVDSLEALAGSLEREALGVELTSASLQTIQARRDFLRSRRLDVANVEAECQAREELILSLRHDGLQEVTSDGVNLRFEGVIPGENVERLLHLADQLPTRELRYFAVSSTGQDAVRIEADLVHGPPYSAGDVR